MFFTDTLSRLHIETDQDVHDVILTTSIHHIFITTTNILQNIYTNIGENNQYRWVHA